MNNRIVIIPGNFRRIWPVLAYTSLILLVSIYIDVDDTSIMGNMLSSGPAGIVKIIAILLLMASSVFWVFYASGDQDVERDRFLVSLPITRHSVVRYPTRFFLIYFSSIAIAIVSITIALRLLGYASTRDLFESLLICLWFPIVTMFGYLISRAVKHLLPKVLFMILALFGCMGPTMNLLRVDEMQAIREILIIMGLISIIFLAISIAGIRNHEKEFINKDLI